jgi:hypothetical protein
LHRSAFGTGHVGCLWALGAHNDIEFDLLAISERAQEFIWVISRHGRLMHKYVIAGVRSIDESVSVLHVEPLDCARDGPGDDALPVHVVLVFLGLVLLFHVLTL